MLELEVLMATQLRQVYDWNLADDIEPFESFERRLLQPNWLHYAIMDGPAWIGALSLELLTPTTCSVHVAKQIGGDRAALRRLIIDTGILLFEAGFHRLVVEILPRNRAAYALATDCGMVPDGDTPDCRYMKLDAEDYFANPEKWKN